MKTTKLNTIKTTLAVALTMALGIAAAQASDAPAPQPTIPAPQAVRINPDNQVSPEDVAKNAAYCVWEYQYVCNMYGYCIWKYVYICY